MKNYVNFKIFLLLLAMLALVFNGRFWIPEDYLQKLWILSLPTGIIASEMLRRRNPWGHMFNFVAAMLFIAYYPRYMHFFGEFLAWALALTSMAGFFIWTFRELRNDNGAKFRPMTAMPMTRALVFIGILATAALTWDYGIDWTLHYISTYAAFTGTILIINRKIEGWLLWAVDCVIGGVIFINALATADPMLWLWFLDCAAGILICAAGFITWRRASQNPGDYTPGRPSI